MARTYRESISQQRLEYRSSWRYKRKVYAGIAGAGVAIGLAIGAASFGGTVVETHTVTKRLVVPDPVPYSVTKEVKTGPSDACKDYIKATEDLLRGQRALSETKANLDEIMRGIHRNLWSTDGIEIKNTEENYQKVSNMMQNAWIEIGNAQVELERLDGSCK